MDILNTTITMLPLVQLVNNEGQLDGVPKNPRQITEAEYRKLVQSLRKDNLTGIEPLKVYKQGEQYVVLGGNQRLRALRELKRTEVPCIIIPADTPAEVLRKVVINDNSNYGEWDMDDLANEWDEQELSAWSVDLPKWEEEDPVNIEELVNVASRNVKEFESGTDYDLHLLYRKKVSPDILQDIERLEREGVCKPEILQVMKERAQQCTIFNFDTLTKYYRSADCSEAERDLLRRLYLVFVVPKELFERKLVEFDERLNVIYDNMLLNDERD